VSDNQVTLAGNLTDDPELRFTPNGAAVANFRLAVDQRVWDTSGWKDGESSYFRVNVWRDQAEHVSRSLHKGARCVVVGRLRSRSWETPEGQRRSAVEVDAEEVGMSLRFAPVAPPPAEAATAEPEPAKAGGNGSRRGRQGRQPAKATAGNDKAPF
jgi:single-strand DNA-binding protein